METIHKFRTSFSLAYAPNKKIIGRCNSGSIMIHSYSTGLEIKRLKKPSNPSHLLFSKDEKYLIVKNTSGTIYVYDLESFEPVHILKSSKNIKVIEGKFLYNHLKNQIIDIMNVNGVNQIVQFDIATKTLTPVTSFLTGEVTNLYSNQQIEDEVFLFTMKPDDEGMEYSIHNVLILDFTRSHVEQSIKKTSFCWNDILYVRSMNKYILLSDDEVQLINGNLDSVERRLSLSTHFPNESFGGFSNQITISKSEKEILIQLKGTIIILHIPTLTILKTFISEYICFGQFINDDKQLLVGTWNNGFIINL